MSTLCLRVGQVARVQPADVGQVTCVRAKERPRQFATARSQLHRAHSITTTCYNT